jgi:lycopene cyclase domain-containing protein
MMNPHYTYLWLDLLSVIFPLLLSFDKKVAFYKHWKYLLPAILVNGTLFVLWDMYFTKHGVWSFNPEYICGVYLFNLPLEEVLFFIVVPYSCAFIYECLNAYVVKEIVTRPKLVTIIVLVLSLASCILFYDKIYTIVNAGICFIVVFIAAFVYKLHRMGRFYFAFFVALIPFLIFDGLITHLPIVSYNDEENMAIRVFSIPIEDFFYCLSLLLNTVLIMDYFKTRRPANTII